MGRESQKLLEQPRADARALNVRTHVQLHHLEVRWIEPDARVLGSMSAATRSVHHWPYAPV